ncbi:hypothetical protein CA260_11930 [Dyella jiangningensis]|uniref:General secretion pathway protein GspH n=1 Tax=Dyella jiangningensis TaxID=1379159 RepID=A0A328P1I0_9GAMM|nr:hypothetical protein CA260_11930 [Dyella jiangningensis]
MPVVNILVVAAVIAVLLALIIPAWRSHGIKQHIADAMKGADAVKLVVMEAATVHGGLAQVRASDLQYNAKASSGEHVGNVEVADGGLITLSTRDTGASPDPVIMFIPTEGAGSGGADITWTCQVVLGDASLAPANCQGHGYVPSNASSAAPASASTVPAPASARPNKS